MRESKVNSPCINLCRLDEITGFCRGCHRSIDEIVAWPHYTDQEKEQVLFSVRNRKNGEDKIIAPGTRGDI